MERESRQSEFDLTIRHRQNGKLSDRVATSTDAKAIEKALDKVARFLAIPIDGALGFSVVPRGNDRLSAGFLNGLNYFVAVVAFVAMTASVSHPSTIAAPWVIQYRSTTISRLSIVLVLKNWTVR